MKISVDSKIFTDVAVLLAAGTGLLYIMGSSFYSAFLNTWGVSAQYLPKDTAELLQIGFIPFFSYGIFLVIIFGPLIWILNLVLTGGFRFSRFVATRFSSRMAKRLTRRREVQNPTPNQKITGKMILVVLMFILFGSFVYSIFGALYAESMMQSLKSEKAIILAMGEGDKQEKFTVVMCSKLTSLCAIYPYKTQKIKLVDISSLDGAQVVSSPKSLLRKMWDEIDKAVAEEEN